MSRPKVTWNGPTKTVADRVRIRPCLPWKWDPTNPKPRKGLRQVSARRKRELKEYSERREAFLARPENRWCPVWAVLVAAISSSEGRRVTRKLLQERTTDVHHMAGRYGKLLNDERHWMAVSRIGHKWIHDNPNEARKLGWLI